MENKDPKKPNPPTSGKWPGGLTLIVIAITVALLINVLFSSMFNNNVREVYYSEFVEMLRSGQVQKVEVQPNRILITLLPEDADGYGYAYDGGDFEYGSNVPAYEPNEEVQAPSGNLFNQMRQNLNAMFNGQRESQTPPPVIVYTGRMPDPQLREMLDNYGVDYTAEIITTNWAAIILNFMMPFLLIIVMFLIIRRVMGGMMGGKGGFMSIGQSNAKVYMEKKTGVTFEDVAGQEEAKESLMEIVDFLHNPEKYTAIGAIQPKGALLVGPPGTGKTLLAKAVAGEANVVFFSLSGSDFVEMFVGVGASRVRDLFKQASQQSPCIIFIDEIDAIGKSRDNQMNSNDEREQTLNQLLAEMDGFDSSKGVVILGATNRPETLDKALLRPGRFDRRINVELPDLKGREDILKVHAKKVKMGANVDLRRIAMITPGGAGADLANMINEAALHAVRMKRNEVHQEDLLEAVEVVIAGKEKKDRIMSQKEKRLVAFHEVGHALASAVQKDAKPVEKITIIPRTKGSLGYVLTAPEEERFLRTKDEMIAEIIVSLAGRAAEEVEFNTKTTGASSDIEKATSMARSMVSMYGMSDKFGMMGLESVQNRYLDGRRVANYSEETGAIIDEEVRKILEECYQSAINLLKANLEKMREIAEFLFNKETITGEEFMEMYRQDQDRGDLVPTP